MFSSVERAWSGLTRRYSDMILNPNDTLHGGNDGNEQASGSTAKPSDKIKVPALNKILDITAGAAEKFTFDGY